MTPFKIHFLGIQNELIGKGEATEKLREELGRAAQKKGPLLLTGKSGTGKTLAARIIHQAGGAEAGPFIQIACGSLKSTNLAVMHEAPEGTLFLKNIDWLEEGMQTRVLDLIRACKQTVNIIASSGDGFAQPVSGENQLYRVVRERIIAVPTLAERGMRDIRLLAQYFIKEKALEMNKTFQGIKTKVFHALYNYSWPGNIEELKYICRRMVQLAAQGEYIDVDRLPADLYSGIKPKKRGMVKFKYEERLFDAVSNFESEYILAMLREYNWNQSLCARVLGIHRNTLLLKIKQLRIPVEKRRGEIPRGTGL
jgi:DNA-binding NtrC family response regulator